MGLPPLETGSVQVKVIEVLAGVAITFVGALGGAGLKVMLVADEETWL